jgi:hypothetical protein
MGIAYFYCDYSNPEKQTLSNIMGSLTAQLSKQSLAFRSAVWKYFDSSQLTHEAARNADPERLLELLIGNCLKFSRVFLALDAIDECSNQARPSSRSQLLEQCWQVALPLRYRPIPLSLPYATMRRLVALPVVVRSSPFLRNAIDSPTTSFRRRSVWISGSEMTYKVGDGVGGDRKAEGA